MLKTLADQNGFTIHDVPHDGNCMFSAIAYQLQSIGICGIDASKLREMVANHLENIASHYCPFVSQLQTPRDDYNADTMPPTDEDAYIDTIADPELQNLLRWQQYLIKLRNGAWGSYSRHCKFVFCENKCA